jgi:hypothetical protein
MALADLSVAISTQREAYHGKHHSRLMREASVEVNSSVKFRNRADETIKFCYYLTRSIQFKRDLNAEAIELAKKTKTNEI